MVDGGRGSARGCVGGKKEGRNGEGGDGKAPEKGGKFWLPMAKPFQRRGAASGEGGDEPGGTERSQGAEKKSGAVASGNEKRTSWRSAEDLVKVDRAAAVEEVASSGSADGSAGGRGRGRGGGEGGLDTYFRGGRASTDCTHGMEYGDPSSETAGHPLL